MAADISIPAALIAGLISFLSPCVLPLVPPYLVYLSGLSLERFADAEPEPGVRRETVIGGVLFVSGFSAIFAPLEARASSMGRLIRVYSDVFAKAPGVAIIIMGLHFLGV